MRLHIENTVYELPRTADPARHGRWAGFQIWDMSGPQLLATHSQRLGDVEQLVEPMELQARVADIAEDLVRFLGLRVDIANIATVTSENAYAAPAVEWTDE